MDKLNILSTRVEDLKPSRQVLHEIVTEMTQLNTNRQLRRAKIRTVQQQLEEVRREISSTLEEQDGVLDRLKQLAQAR